MTPEELMKASREQAREELDSIGFASGEFLPALKGDGADWGDKDPVPGVDRRFGEVLPTSKEGKEQEAAQEESFDELLDRLTDEEEAEQSRARILGAHVFVEPAQLTRGDILFILNMGHEEYFALKSPYKAAWEQVLARLDTARNDLNTFRVKLLNELPPAVREFVQMEAVLAVKAETITATMLRHRAAYERKVELAKTTHPADPAKVKKQCTSCLKTKALTEFHSRCDRPDGRENRCKECRKARIKSIKRSGA